MAWGDNRSDAVVAGSSVVVQPIVVVLPEAVADLAAGDWQSYAVDTAGSVWQWGDPNGPTPPWPGEEPTDFSVPTIVPVPAPVVEIAAGGSHALALAADGRLWTWGRNSFGELGYAGPGNDSLQMVPGRFATVDGGDYGRLRRTGATELGQFAPTHPMNRGRRAEKLDDRKIRNASST